LARTTSNDCTILDENDIKEIYLYGMTHILLNKEEIDEVLYSSASNIIDNLNIFQEM